MGIISSICNAVYAGLHSRGLAVNRFPPGYMTMTSLNQFRMPGGLFFSRVGHADCHPEGLCRFTGGLVQLVVRGGSSRSACVCAGLQFPLQCDLGAYLFSLSVLDEYLRCMDYTDCTGRTAVLCLVGLVGLKPLDGLHSQCSKDRLQPDQSSLRVQALICSLSPDSP